MSHPLKRLVKLVARTFHSGECPPKDHEDAETTGRGSRSKAATAGLALVILDYLVERDWVQEAVMLSELNVHQKIMRRALKYLEREHFLMSEHRRETAARKDVVNAITNANAAASAAAAAALTAQADGQAEDEIPDDGFDARPPRGLTISYYAIDYPRFYDALQLRLVNMRRVLKAELETANAVQDYQCPTSWCAKRFTSLDAAVLMDHTTQQFLCDICKAPLQQLLASGGVGDEKERKARREEARVLLQRMEADIREVNTVVKQCAPMASPHPGTLHEWAQEQQRRRQLSAAEGGSGGHDQGHHGGHHGGHRSGGSGTPWQDTQIKVNLQTGAGAAAPGASAAPGRQGASALPGASTSAAGAADSKPAPPKASAIPWFNQQAGPSNAGQPSDDVKEDGKTAEQSAVYQAFMQQYMAQLHQQQQQQQQQQLQPPQQQQQQQQVQGHAAAAATPAAAAAAPDTAGAMDDDIEWEDN